MHSPRLGSLISLIPLTRLAAFLAIGLWLSGCATVEDKPKPASASASLEKTVQLQIFLDSQNFGPGVVDGRVGEFTYKALALYRASRGFATDYQPETAGIVPYRAYTIEAGDLSVLGSMAVEPADIALQKKLPYTNLLELLGERFHTTQAFLLQLNPSTDFENLAAGDSIEAPNVRRPLRTDSYPSSYPAPQGSVAGSRRVLVDTGLRMLEVKEGDRLIAAFPITPGSSEHPAPIGEWKVVKPVPWPWYRYDEGVLKRGERTADFYNFPPGPNSPVGLLWTGLNRPGVGIHGTSSPETIGRSGSHGCIRLSNWDAATFRTLVQRGMAVTIR